MEFTAWQVLRSEMSDLAVVDCDYLQRMRIREKVPIAYCMNVKDITKIQSLQSIHWQKMMPINEP